MYPAMAYIHFEQNNSYTAALQQYHERCLRTFARANHLKILQLYTDTSHKTSGQKSPEFLSMLENMKTRNISLILTPSVRHIARGIYPVFFIPPSCCFYAVKEQILLPLFPEILL